MPETAPTPVQAPAPAVEAVPAAPAPSQPRPADPKDVPVVGRDGVPLTAAASLEDLLNAPDPLVIGKAEVVRHEVPASEGQPVGTPTEPIEPAATPSEPAEPPPEAAPEPEAAAEPATPAAPPLDEPSLIQRLTEEKRGLLRLKGEQARQVGDLRQTIEALSAKIEALQHAPPPNGHPQMSDEELTARLLEKPSEVILTPDQIKVLVRQEAEQMLVQQAQAWQAQQIQEQSQVAPEVAKDLFRARHQIAQPFEEWLQTDDGKAVNEIVFKDPLRRRALEGYRDDGDVMGMADVLSNALDLRRTGQKAAKARHAVTQERQRIEASKPASNPPPPTASHPNLPKPFNIYDKNMTEAELYEWAKTAEPYEREG